MNSILEVSKEGITIHEIPLENRIATGSEEWLKIPDRTISHLESNIQFRLVDGKSLMVYLLDKTSKVNVRGKEHEGPKTVIVPHNEKITLETGHSLRLSINIKEDKKIFSKATIFQADLPGLKIDGVPVVFNSQDDAVEIVDKTNTEIEEFLTPEADEIEIDEILQSKAELSKMYYSEDEELPNEPPPVEEIKSDQEKEEEAIETVIAKSTEGLSEDSIVEIEDEESEQVEEEIETENQINDINEIEIAVEEEVDEDEEGLLGDYEIDDPFDENLENEQDFQINEEEIVEQINQIENEEVEEQFTSDDEIHKNIENVQEVQDVQSILEVKTEFEEEDQIDEDDRIDENNEIDNEESEFEESTEDDIPIQEEDGLKISNPENDNQINHPKKNLKFDSLPENFFDDDDDDDDEINTEESTDPNINILEQEDTNEFDNDTEEDDDEKNEKDDIENEEIEIDNVLEMKPEENMSAKKKLNSPVLDIEFEDPTKENSASLSTDFKMPEEYEGLEEFNNDDSENTMTETEFIKEDKNNSNNSQNDDHGLYPEEDTIQYDEMDYDSPDVSEIKEAKNQGTKSFTMASHILNKFKGIFSKSGQELPLNLEDDPNDDEEDDETSDDIHYNEFDTFKDRDETGSINNIKPQKDNFLSRIKKYFKKEKVYQPEDYFDEEELAEMTEAEAEAEEIENSLVQNFGKELDEINELDTERGIKKERDDLVKVAKKSKKKHAQDPRPGIPGKVLSLALSAFIIFNLNFILENQPKYNRIYQKHVDQKVIKLKKPLKNVFRKTGTFVQKKAPSPIIKKYSAKIFKFQHIDTLFKGPYHRYLSLFIIYELLCLIIFGNSLPLFLFGARNDAKILKSRIQALTRFILWPITLILPILDIQLLIGRRSFREWITKSYILYPSTSIRNFTIIFAIPITLISFFLYPYFLNLSLFSSIDIATSKYNRVDLSDMEYSKVLDLSIKPKLRPGYVFLPSWSIEKNRKLYASLQIYSIRTDQSAFLRKHKPIDFIKIIKTAGKKDPFFLKYYPDLAPFVIGRTKDATEKSFQVMNDLFTNSIKFSATDMTALKELYQTGPYIQDNIFIKKEFLNNIESDGIQKVIIHSSNNEKTIEVIPSKQPSLQTSYFVTFTGKNNHLYSLTYSKKARETRAEMTNLALNQINFNLKAGNPTTDHALKTLESFKNLVDPSYSKEDAYREVFEYYYALGKLSLESNQKKFIDMTKLEIYKTGELIGSLKQNPIYSQKYKERFRNLSKALETLDSRYFSM